MERSHHHPYKFDELNSFYLLLSALGLLVYDLDLKKQEGSRNSLVLVGVSPL